MKRLFVLIGLALAFRCILEAKGLELYSYVDDEGQLIVVDSLERIPIRYRSKADKNFIASFKGGDFSELGDEFIDSGVELSNNGFKEKKLIKHETSNSMVVAASDESKVTIIEPVEGLERLDSGIDEASSLLYVMSAILENNRQIYNLVLGTRKFSPAVKSLHTRNIAALARAKDPANIPWKRVQTEKKQWSSRASLLLERFRTIQYTLSKWLGEKPDNLLYGLPAFIKASEMRVNELNVSLEALKKLDEQLIEQERRAKNKK